MDYQSTSFDDIDYKNIEEVVITNLRKSLQPIFSTFENKTQKYKALSAAVRQLPEFQSLIMENTELKLKLAKYNAEVHNIDLKITEKSSPTNSVEFIAEKNAETKMHDAMLSGLTVSLDSHCEKSKNNKVPIKKEKTEKWWPQNDDSDVTSKDNDCSTALDNTDTHEHTKNSNDVEEDDTDDTDEQEVQVEKEDVEQKEDEEEEEEDEEVEVEEEDEEENEEEEIEVEEEDEEEKEENEEEEDEEVEVEEVEEEEEDEEEEVEVEEEEEEDEEEDEEEEEEEEDEEDEEEEVEVEEEDDDEEVKVEEEKVDVEEEDDEEDDEEEEEEVYMIELDGVNYYTEDDNNGNIYEILEDEEIGEKIGYFKDGEPHIN